jgi:hypothetical protein
VSKQGAAAVQAAIAQEDETSCAAYQDECPFIRPPCAPPDEPSCSQGVCK